ncbi:MAG: hypothetical protein P1R58_10165 [bacterium]|nr:hypothetical protein [bacterium]
MGKLTVARQLSLLTGYKVAHNHLSLDLAESVFDYGSKEFRDFVIELRLLSLQKAVANGVPGIISTFCYALKEDDDYVRRIIGTVEEGGGEVHFVLLNCSRPELEERVCSPDRAATTKIKSAETLRSALNRNELGKEIPFVDNLVIKNDEIEPIMAARIVIEKFDLNMV